MNTKLLFLAIASALTAAAASFAESANGINDAQLDLDLSAGTGTIDHAAIAAASADLDADGLPWDQRIHSGSKSKNADGRWKAVKNRDAAVYDAVVAELRKTYPAPATGAGAVSPPVVAAITPPAPPATVVAPPPPPAITMPAIPAPPPPPVTPYTRLCDWLAKNTGEGHVLNDEWLKGMWQQSGITLAGLAADQERAQATLDALRGCHAQTGETEVV